MVEPTLRLLPALRRELHIHKSAPEWARSVIVKLGGQFDVKTEWDRVKGQKAFILMGDAEAYWPLCVAFRIGTAGEAQQVSSQAPCSQAAKQLRRKGHSAQKLRQARAESDEEKAQLAPGEKGRCGAAAYGNTSCPCASKRVLPLGTGGAAAPGEEGRAQGHPSQCRRLLSDD